MDDRPTVKVAGAVGGWSSGDGRARAGIRTLRALSLVRMGLILALTMANVAVATDDGNHTFSACHGRHSGLVILIPERGSARTAPGAPSSSPST